MTSRLPLHEFIEAFGENPLVLPCCFLVGSTRATWSPVLEAVRTSGWASDVVTENAGTIPLAQLRRDLVQGEKVELRTPTGLYVRFYYRGAEDVYEVEFDVDLRQFVRQDNVDDLCDVISLIGHASGHDVAITDESGMGDPIIRWSRSTGIFAVAKSS